MINNSTNNDSIENGYNSDTAEPEEINSLFAPCKHVYSQSLGPKYILHLSATRESSPDVAAALSDCTCDIFRLSDSQVIKLAQLKEHTDKIISCKFSHVNHNILYTASNDGTIKVWDLRELKAVITFTDTTLEEDSLIKPLCSFDVTPCDRLFAAGTDLVESDAYILFWDVRTPKLLGAYWESHTDDITQVKFHPNDGNKLMSGSTDGLINIYNLLETSEDDALQECLNTEQLVEDLLWFDKSKISCVSSTNEWQLWDTDGAEPYKKFSRAKVGWHIKKATDNTYIADIHHIKDGWLFALAGSNGHQGECLRSFTVSCKGEVSPSFQFVENTQRVRASWMSQQTDLLLTGGEKGKLDIWKPDLYR